MNFDTTVYVECHNEMTCHYICTIENDVCTGTMTVIPCQGPPGVTGVQGPPGPQVR